MEKKNVGQRLYGDNYNPKSKEKSTETIDEINTKYKKAWLYNSFNLNPLFSPIKNEIDKRFNSFFDKWIGLSSNNSKQALTQNKHNIRDIFYNLAFEEIYKDAYLMNALTMIANSQKKIEKGDNDIYQRIIEKAELEHFIPIIDEVFEIPNLVLSSFGESSFNFKKQLRVLKTELNKAKKRSDEMTGRKLTHIKKQKYLAILQEQKRLIQKYGKNSQSSSLSNAIRLNEKGISDKQVKSISQSIRYHQGKGNLPK